MFKIIHDQLALDHLKRKYATTLQNSYQSTDNIENEIWKPMIFDYESNLMTSKRYLVSNYGRIRNNDTDRLLKPWKNKDGYLLIDIVEPGIKEIKRQVHRLVAYAFIPNPNNLPQINHKRYGEEFKDFNHTDNLEWVTSSENIKHLKISTGTDILTIDQLYKIKELIQIDDWTTTSLVNAIGYPAVTPKLKKCIQTIYERRAHKDIFGDVKFGRRMKESWLKKK